MKKQTIQPKLLSFLELSVIIVLAIIPLFVSFPYRVNIFLSWEGAFRMSQGELPFRDFGTPLGGMYWVMPGIFFKIFGAQMITLVKAQVFINVLSGLAFRSILKSLQVNKGLRFCAVLLYCISFSFFNFWPWYNHTVIVYEFIAIAFLLKALLHPKNNRTFIFLILAALFTACSFFTKQDAGGMTVAICLAICFLLALQQKAWKNFFVYAGSVFIIGGTVVALFWQQGFSYWFNHGQPPHTGRISLREILTEFFMGSQWIRFYVFVILLLLVLQFEGWKKIWQNTNQLVFLILTMAVLGEAAVFQVTSYTPPDNNIFYHSFAFVYILTLLSQCFSIEFLKKRTFAICTLGVLLWWSQVYWKYFQKITDRMFPETTATVSANDENIVNRQTFMINPVDTTDIPVSQWIFSSLESFKKIYMPPQTVAGINRVMNLPVVKQQKTNIKVLNMSELTPLAKEMPFELEKGTHYPLWNHLGVGMFNKEAVMFERKIVNKEYDLVLFEHIPSLNNFYPFRVRDSLLRHYNKIDSFPAPRQGETKGNIEVFVK